MAALKQPNMRQRFLVLMKCISGVVDHVQSTEPAASIKKKPVLSELRFFVPLGKPMLHSNSVNIACRTHSTVSLHAFCMIFWFGVRSFTLEPLLRRRDFLLADAFRGGSRFEVEGSPLHRVANPRSTCVVRHAVSSPVSLFRCLFTATCMYVLHRSTNLCESFFIFRQFEALKTPAHVCMGKSCLYLPRVIHVGPSLSTFSSPPEERNQPPNVGYPKRMHTTHAAIYQHDVTGLANLLLSLYFPMLPCGHATDGIASFLLAIIVVYCSILVPRPILHAFTPTPHPRTGGFIPPNCDTVTLSSPPSRHLPLLVPRDITRSDVSVFEMSMRVSVH